MLQFYGILFVLCSLMLLFCSHLCHDLYYWFIFQLTLVQSFHLLSLLLSLSLSVICIFLHLRTFHVLLYQACLVCSMHAPVSHCIRIYIWVSFHLCLFRYLLYASSSTSIVVLLLTCLLLWKTRRWQKLTLADELRFITDLVRFYWCVGINVDSSNIY